MLGDSTLPSHLHIGKGKRLWVGYRRSLPREDNKTYLSGWDEAKMQQYVKGLIIINRICIILPPFTEGSLLESHVR